MIKIRRTAQISIWSNYKKSERTRKKIRKKDIQAVLTVSFTDLHQINKIHHRVETLTQNQ